MKRQFIALLMAAVCSLYANAQDINLPQPDLSTSTLTVGQALKTRHSVRNFTSTPLSTQMIANVCWAACGVNRDNGNITAPSAMNKQEIRLFVFNADGVYEYLAKSHTLKFISSGDHRNLVAGRQASVAQAPVSLVMVIDFDKMGEKSDRNLQWGCVDAGNVSENVNLYCQSAGLATVPRASMDTEAISKLLGLTDNQLPIMNNPVGYEAK